MLIRIGNGAKSGEPVVVDTERVVNPHLQVTGVTGLGKTYILQEMLASFVESAAELGKPVRVHVFDPHGDIELPFSSVVKFSEATGFGYNPFEVNTDPDCGGVRRAIQRFIAAAKKHKALGTKQEAAMRYILEDVYSAHGFKADDPQTWTPDDPRTIRAIMTGGKENRSNRVYLEVAFEHRERFKDLLKAKKLFGHRGGFDDFDGDPAMQQKRSWWIDRDSYEGDFLMWEPRNLFKTSPTLDDVVRFTERKLEAQFCGTNSAAMALLRDVNQASGAYQRKVTELAKRDAAMADADKVELIKALDKAKEKAVDAYRSYLDAIVNGRELSDLIRYHSTDVLTSVYERFQNLRAIRIYNPTPPPFDPRKPIWQYSIKPLEIPVQSMFVDMVCSRVFERALQRGVQADVIELIVLDEAKRFLGESADDIVNKISNEARKFGLGLWVLSQTPEHFSDDIIKGSGTIIVLGLAHADTKVAARKLGVDEGLLRAVVPQKTALVKIWNRGMLGADFQVVSLA